MERVGEDDPVRVDVRLIAANKPELGEDSPVRFYAPG